MYCLPKPMSENQENEMITMATSTYDASGAILATGQSKPSLLNRMMDRIVEAQTRRARVMVADFFAEKSDVELSQYGWSQEEIKRLRGR